MTPGSVTPGVGAAGGRARAARLPRTVLTVERSPPTGEREWALALLPAFPLLLLVLRVWYLARQDLQTVLLVLQSANPLGLIASLLISFVWAVPATLLVLRALYLMLLAGAVPSRSWLARVGARTPVWVSVPAAGVAALSWQLRFLPALFMVVLVIAGLELRYRLPAALPVEPAWAVVSVLTVLPVLVWVAPAAVRAVRSQDDPITAVLLIAPLIAAPLLPGPLPVRVARWLLPGLATVVVIAVPVLLGQRYLNAPVLPRVAVRYQPAAQVGAVGADGADGAAGQVSPRPEQVARGSLVSVDDRFVTLLEPGGRVRFIASGQVVGQELCSTGPEPPASPVTVHGWQVEQSVLSWAGPTPSEQVTHPDCRGA